VKKIRPFHHQRPLAAFALAYGAGIWAGVRFSWQPIPILLALLLSVGLIILLKKGGRRAIAGWMCAALCAGYLLAGLICNPSLPPKGRYLVTGIAAQDMVIREDGKVGGYLEQVTLEGDNVKTDAPRVYWTYVPEADHPFLPLEGQSVSFLATLYYPNDQDNPYGFDFRLFLLQRGVSIGVSGANDAVITGTPTRGVASLFYQARKALSRQIQLIFGEESALPEALLVGVKDHLPEETTRLFSDAGVAHILSVSGLHVALLASVLMWPLRSLLSPGKRFGVMSIFLVAYCALLDFAAPVVRASLLLLFAQARRMVRKAPDQLTTLAAAFLMILLVRPLDLFSASFQLSFAAVLGIALFTEQLTAKLHFFKFRSVMEGCAVTIGATAGTAIPTIQLFNRFSIIGIWINPVVCAFLSILLPVYALVALVGCIYLPLGQMLAGPVNFAASLVIRGIEWMGALPFATVNCPNLPFYVVLALVFAMLLFSRYVVWPGRTRLIAGVCSVAAATMIWPLSTCRDVQYIQLDAGQADCAMVLDGNETWVLDAGDYGGDLASYLKATGRRADHVLITHLHSDHCLGLNELMEEHVSIGVIYLPVGALDQEVAEECREVIAAAERTGADIRFLSAGDVLESERTKITVTWPNGDAVKPGHDPNRFALALLWDLDGVKLFSASDLEGNFEHYAAMDADVLKVSHHGSKNETRERFLEMVSPQIALITASEGSSTHPHPDTSNRLAQSGVSVYNIGETGALTIRVKDGDAAITTFHQAEEKK